VQVSPRFGLGFGLTHQDDSFIDNGNSAILPSYTRLDAAAFYELSARTRIQLNIENAGDELYFPNAHSTHQASVGRPLNARVTISSSF
jgi:catecholate siderophore receptor